MSSEEIIESLLIQAHKHNDAGNHTAVVALGNAALTFTDITKAHALNFRKLMIISCYYTGTAENAILGKKLCNDLNWDRELPWHDRWFGRINLVWYSKKAADLYPSTTVKTINWKPDNDYNCMNPSICNFNGQLYMVIRTVNYDISYTDNNHYYDMKDNDQWIVRTRNYLANFDADLEITQIREILLPETLPPVAFPQVIGFEDMRLFECQGDLWTSSTVRQLTPEGWHEIVVARMDLQEQVAQLDDWWVAHPDHCPKAQEKNWMAAVKNDELFFIYNNDPVTVLDHAGKCVAQNVNKLPFDNFRGGSPLIPFDNGYLSIIHETSVYDYMPRHYMHRFVYYNTDFEIQKISDIFYLHEKGIEFAAGMCWDNTHTKLHVSFGFKDKLAMIATFDAAEVLAGLTAV
jgi:hypothetical protein